MRKTAVIFALYWELRPFARRLGMGFAASLAPVFTAKDGEVILARSGMGTDNARHTAEKVIKEYNPDIVISAGFCGALVKDLGVGDIIVSDLRDRKLYCSPKPLFTCEEKTEVFRREGSIVVDMESSGVAEAAMAAGVQFLAVKAVSDTLLDDLPRSLLWLLSPSRLMRFREASRKASNNLSGFLLEYINKGATS
jgi:nucleoside phosphorylase